MQFFGSISGVLLVAAVSFAPFAATARIADDQPAEYPPASYTGAQYVDSKGCIYVRAGYAGQVNWVPRVTRDRKALCGFKPTFAAAAPQPAPQPAPVVTPPARTAPLPTVALTTEMPVATGPAKPPARLTAQMQPAPVVRYSAPVATPVRPGPAAKPVRMIAAPVPPTPARTAGGFDGCTNLSATARHYTKAPAGVAVRCGPQAGSFGSYVIQTVPAGTTVQTASGRVYVTDKPVKVRVAASATTNTTTAIKPPKGYKSAFKDDRLNPMRGPRTAAGDAQMARIWSDDTPSAMVAKPAPQRTAVLRTPTATRVSTKSVAVASAQPTRAVTGGANRYVQVGTFGEPSNAARTTARLKGMGYPVSMSTIRKGNKTLQIVLAGPFTAEAQLNSALNGARAAGFRDAFPRR